MPPRGRYVHPRSHATRVVHPGMDRPGREPGRVRPSGTGKSYFVEALAQKAIEADLPVAWFTLET